MKNGKRKEVLIGSYAGIAGGWQPVAEGLGLQILPTIQDWVWITPENLESVRNEMKAFREHLCSSHDPNWEGSIEVLERVESELLELSDSTGWSAEIG